MIVIVHRVSRKYYAIYPGSSSIECLEIWPVKSGSIYDYSRWQIPGKSLWWRLGGTIQLHNFCSLGNQACLQDSTMINIYNGVIWGKMQILVIVRLVYPWLCSIVSAVLRTLSAYLPCFARCQTVLFLWTLGQSVTLLLTTIRHFAVRPT